MTRSIGAVTFTSQYFIFAKKRVAALGYRLENQAITHVEEPGQHARAARSFRRLGRAQPMPGCSWSRHWRRLVPAKQAPSAAEHPRLHAAHRPRDMAVRVQNRPHGNGHAFSAKLMIRAGKSHKFTIPENEAPR